MADSWSKDLPFAELCDMLDMLVKNDPTKKRKLQIQEGFVKHCRGKMNSVVETGSSLFPVVRLILPQCDKERGSYQLKEAKFEKIFTDVLGIKNGQDADRLKNFKAPKNATKEGSDFAAILHDVIKYRAYQRTKLSVADVNDKLDELVRQYAIDGMKAAKELIKGLFLNMDAGQIMWLVRIILKDMKLGGLGLRSVMNIIHPDAMDCYDVNSNLRKVCQDLRDPGKRMHEIDIKLFAHFRPMLADRVSIGKVVDQMDNRKFFIETKYDGERMQAHFNNNEFRFFSRNGNDFTDEFGARPGDGKFSYYVKKALSSDVKSVILDGEICAYNKITETLMQKGEQMNIRQLRDDDPTFQQCLYLYDIVYLNGQVLTNKPLKERLQILEKQVIKSEISGRIHFAKRETATTTEAVVEALNNAIDRREEGIVIKHPLSVYKPNARSKAGWIKCKPEYNDQLMDQCDLIVIGGYYGGRAKSKNAISNFLLAVRDDKDPEGKPVFRSFVKVGSGYNEKELFDMLQQLNPYLEENKKKSRQQKYKSGALIKCDKETPDVWIEPQKSVVLQVKAAEIIKDQGSYHVGCTLRFPRVEKIRKASDRDWTNCMTYEELQNLRSANDGKLSKRHFELDEDGDGGGPEVKRKRTSGRGTKKQTLPSIYQQIDPSIEAITNALDKKVIVIGATALETDLKKDLERIVLKHGGIVEQNFIEDRTFIFVKAGNTLTAQNLVKEKRCNVVKPEWLLDCKEKFRPLQPSDMIYATDETKEAFEINFDQYGNSYKQKSTMESLKYSMEQVKKSGKARVTDEEIAEIEHEYKAFGLGKYGFFCGCRAHFLTKDKDGASVDLAMANFRFYGGKVVDSLSQPEIEQLTHVLVFEEDLVAKAKSARRKLAKKFHIVSPNWIDECIVNRENLAAEDFEL